MAGTHTSQFSEVNAPIRELTGRSLPRFWMFFAMSILLVGAGLRLAALGMMLYRGDAAAWRTSDTVSYESMANSLLSAGNFQTGHPDVRVHALHRPPGFPLFAIRWLLSW